MLATLKEYVKPFVPPRFRHHFSSANDRRYWWLTGMPKSRLERSRLVTYELQEGSFIEAYWVDRPDGTGGWDKGPVAILVVHGSEILKFDCYGRPTGHYHVAAAHPKGIRNALYGRLWFPEKTAEQQIDRMIFELLQNLGEFLEKHPRRKVRRTRIDARSLASVCDQMKEKMLTDLRELGEKEGAQRGHKD